MLEQGNEVFEMLVDQISRGKSPEAAAAGMVRLGIAEGAVFEAEQLRLDLAERTRNLTDPPTLRVEPSERAWYVGPQPNDKFWPSVLRGIVAKGIDPADIDAASTRVVSHLGWPQANQIDTRGLVLGYVQSGKTSNYTAVAAKAADAGYRLIIVLAGIHNSLRRQTQVRLEKDLVEGNKKLWLPLTSDTQDFGIGPNPDPLLSSNDIYLLAVVKKNKSRLQRLIDWLRSAEQSSLQQCPVLVIDDEADQASLNTKDEFERSAINDQVVQLLSFPKVAYVGYTATPFANLFVDPSVSEQLYPRDFIVDLPEPAKYFGARKIFGGPAERTDDDETEFDGYDMIRSIPEDDVRLLQPPRKKDERGSFEPQMTGSLAKAVRYFVMSTAAREVRDGREAHASMLVHTTMFTDMHERFRWPVQSELYLIQDALVGGMPEVLAELQDQWADECERVRAADFALETVPWAELVTQMEVVLRDVRIVIDNYRSDERLTYEEGRQIVIAIGGNTLSRGLTLEGLCVSYFLRSASAYDTLLQMGRWFGYRIGYEDLPRIWMTPELAMDFRHLAGVESEIRTDVQRYEGEGATPTEFGVRIRTHPKLAITSALKMQHAVEINFSYSARRVQTIWFDHTNRTVVGGNLAAARGLVQVANRSATKEEPGSGPLVYRGVGSEAVLEFLASYSFSDRSPDVAHDPLAAYIKGRISEDELHNWNVAIITRVKPKHGVVDLGVGRDVPLVLRAKLKDSPPNEANIKALMSKADRIVDLPERGTIKMSDVKDAELQALRPRCTHDKDSPGLLLLYPIAANSPPTSDARRELGAADNLIGVGMVFPETANHNVRNSHMTVDLSGVEREEVEIKDYDSIDNEESFNPWDGS